jgi:hypothetical protein
MNSHFDMSDAEGQELDYCKLCGTAAIELSDDGECVVCKEEIAATSDEERNDMESPKYPHNPDLGDAPPAEPFDWNTRLNLLLDEASDLEIKTAGYALERVKAKRLEAAHQRIRDLDPKAPRPRARRSDADKPRAPKAVKNP